MEPASEKNLEEKLYNYLEENHDKAFTFRALKQRLEDIIQDPNGIEYARENLLKVIKKMRSEERIKTTKHEGVTHFFVPELFKSTQNNGESIYFTPETFVLGIEGKKGKPKMLYCKTCKKNVIPIDTREARRGHRKLSWLISPLKWGDSKFSESNKMADSRRGATICPNCGGIKFSSAKKEKKA